MRYLISLVRAMLCVTTAWSATAVNAATDAVNPAQHVELSLFAIQKLIDGHDPYATVIVYLKNNTDSLLPIANWIYCRQAWDRALQQVTPPEPHTDTRVKSMSASPFDGQPMRIDLEPKAILSVYVIAHATDRPFVPPQMLIDVTSWGRDLLAPQGELLKIVRIPSDIARSGRYVVVAALKFDGRIIARSNTVEIEWDRK